MSFIPTFLLLLLSQRTDESQFADLLSRDKASVFGSWHLTKVCFDHIDSVFHLLNLDLVQQKLGRRPRDDFPKTFVHELDMRVVLAEFVLKSLVEESTVWTHFSPFRSHNNHLPVVNRTVFPGRLS